MSYGYGGRPKVGAFRHDGMDEECEEDEEEELSVAYGDCWLIWEETELITPR